MTNTNRDSRELSVRVNGMRYYKALNEANKIHGKLLDSASSYIKEVYDGELEDISLNIKTTQPNTVIIIYKDKENNSQRIEIPLWGE